MSEIGYKYYVSEGPATEALIEESLRLQSNYVAKAQEILAKYGACNAVGYRGEAPTALLFPYNPDKPLPNRNGFCAPGLDYANDNMLMISYKPNLRTKLGKLIKSELESLGGFNWSQYVLKKFGIDCRVHGSIGGRFYLCRPICGCYGNKIVFKIPFTKDEEIGNLPPEFKEIPKSEFVRITEG